MKKAIVAQILILVAAWYFMTPDILKDNTWVFGLIGSVETVKGNTDWVLLGAACLSVFNIWVWWPSRKVINTPSATPITPIAAEDANTKSAKAEEVKAEDPVVPKMD